MTPNAQAKRVFFRLFLTFWILYALHFHHTHSGANRFYYLTMAIVENGEIALDSLPLLDRSDLLLINGKLHCNTNPGVAFLATPLYWVAFQFQNLIFPQASSTPAIHELFAHAISYLMTNALTSAIVASLLGYFIFRRTGEIWRGVLGSILYALGTPVFRFSSHLNQNTIVTALCVLLFLLLFEKQMFGHRIEKWKAAVTGFLSGIGLMCDLSIAPFLIIFLIATVGKWSLKDYLAFLAASVPPLLMLFWYQNAAYGNPFLPAQAYYPVDGKLGIARWMSQPGIFRFLDQTVLPTHGLIFFLPFSLLALLFLFSSRGIEILSKAELKMIQGTVAIYALYVLFNASSLNTQFGPRYLMPVFPFLALIFAIYLQPRWLQAGMVLAGMSLFINLAGAQLGYGTNNIFEYIGLYVYRGPWIPMFDWMKSPLAATTGYSFPQFTSTLGPMLLVLFLLLILWIPLWFVHLFKTKPNEL